MDSCGRLVESLYLSIQCRRCGFAENDEFEALDGGSVQTMRCAGCGAASNFAVIECIGCGAETLFSWAARPAAKDLGSLECAACERRYFDEATGTIPFS